MKSIILGTAGHIDHGKTSLIKALTGVDCDRLPEEKARGITIELGFAHLRLDDVRFGIVDVPGHERFVRAMVAGAGGMDLVMLIIAADEGVMPQTLEHLDICGLLAVPRGFVVLTKADLVDADWLTLVTEEVRNRVSGTLFQNAPIIPVSAVTGAGLDDLRRALLDLAKEVPTRGRDGLLRLPLDRVFTIKGFGTVVTGTAGSGCLRKGDDVLLLPSGASAKVRGLEVHDSQVEEAWAGQRVAVNLLGVEKGQVFRGDVLVHPGSLAACSIVDGLLRYLPVCRKALKSPARVLFHTGTTQVMGSVVLLENRELAPGGEMPVQFHLDSPIVALPGDRFILRGFSVQENYGTTLGGGEIVRVHSPKLRKVSAEAAMRLRAMWKADAQERVALEIAGAGFAGLDRSQMLARLAIAPRVLDRAIEKLASLGIVIYFDRERGAVVHRDTFADLAERALEQVDRFHQEQALQRGMSREELRSKLPADISPRLFHVLVESQLQKGALGGDREIVHRPSFVPADQAAMQNLAPLVARIAAELKTRGLAPPRPAEMALSLGCKESDVSEALRLLVEDGLATKVADLAFDRVFVEELRKRLIDFLETKGQITPQEWKELCSVTRKFSIPLAEYFDAQKLTVRVGDVRKFRGRA